jgi:hypothetical protein
MTSKSIFLLICHNSVDSRELRGGVARHISNIFERDVTSRTYLKSQDQFQQSCVADPNNPLCQQRSEPQERNVISPINLDLTPNSSPVGIGIPNISSLPSFFTALWHRQNVEQRSQRAHLLSRDVLQVQLQFRMVLWSVKLLHYWAKYQVLRLNFPFPQNLHLYKQIHHHHHRQQLA